MKNRRLDELIDFLTENSPWQCSYCKTKLPERRLLREHRSVCFKFRKQSLKVVTKAARAIWKLIRKDAPLGYVRMSVPQQKSKSVLIAIPDLRETPFKQEYNLDIVAHKKKEHRYRMILRVEPYKSPFRVIGILESDSVPLIFVKKITKSSETLCDFNNITKRRFYLWIYVI